MINLLCISYEIWRVGYAYVFLWVCVCSIQLIVVVNADTARNS